MVPGARNTHARGGSRIEHWNGGSWSLASTPAIPEANGGGLFSVTCVNGSDCWAVGAVLGVAGDGSPAGSLTEHWDGSSWSMVPSPTPAGDVGALLQGVSCTSTSNCWAVGFGTDDNGENLNSVSEHWDGTSWSLVSSGATGQSFDQLDNVHCISASDCWADGNAGPVQQNPNFLPIFPGAVGDQGLIEHWDGVMWSVVPSPSEPSPDGGYLNGLTCVDAADCWASGATTDTTGMAAGVLMEHWDGSAWSIVATAGPDTTKGSILSSVSCISASQCWAVGSSGSFGGGGGSGFQPEQLHRELEWIGVVDRSLPQCHRAQFLELGDLFGGDGMQGGRECRDGSPTKRSWASIVHLADDSGRGHIAGDHHDGPRWRRLHVRHCALLGIRGWSTPQQTHRRNRDYA